VCPCTEDRTIFRWRDCAACYVGDVTGVMYGTPLQHLGRLFFTFTMNSLRSRCSWHMYIDHDSCIWEWCLTQLILSDIKWIWSPLWSRKRFFYWHDPSSTFANPRWPCIRMGLSTSLSLVGPSTSSGLTMSQPAFTLTALTTVTISHPVNTKRWLQCSCCHISAQCCTWTTLTCGKYWGPWHTSWSA